eukprot:297905_1
MIFRAPNMFRGARYVMLNRRLFTTKFNVSANKYVNVANRRPFTTNASPKKSPSAARAPLTGPMLRGLFPYAMLPVVAYTTLCTYLFRRSTRDQEASGQEPCETCISSTEVFGLLTVSLLLGFEMVRTPRERAFFPVILLLATGMLSYTCYKSAAMINWSWDSELPHAEWCLQYRVEPAADCKLARENETKSKEFSSFRERLRSYFKDEEQEGDVMTEHCTEDESMEIGDE